MISATELKVQRDITLAFIDADSLEVTLLRSLRTANGSGGYKRGAPVERPVQTMRLIPSQDGTIERMTADGVSVEPHYILMGRWDADLLRWDRFINDGVTYEVVFVNQNKQYEVKGEVVRLGD